MQKIKILIFTLLVLVLFNACGEYQKVLNKGKNVDRYKLAVELYEKKEYKKTIPLFEKLVGPYAGKPQMERIQYMISDSYFQEENYAMSSYYFSKFIVNYPESSKVEEAAYLSAKSYFLASPRYSLDQEDTYKALSAFQNFIDTYPTSDLIPEANEFYRKLNNRLEKKDFEVAKQYYHTERYNAAITAFDTFNEDHLGSVFKEDAMFYKFKASYDLGIKSILSKKEQRLSEALLAYNKFKRSFPESKKMKEMDRMVNNINKELNKLKEQLSTISQKN